MLTPSNGVKATPPATNPSEFDLQNIRHAIFQAEQGLKEAGVPIGAALVRNDGVVIGVGRNRRVQQNSPCRHGEVRSSLTRNRSEVCLCSLLCPRRTASRRSAGYRRAFTRTARESRGEHLFVLCYKDTDSLPFQNFSMYTYVPQLSVP